MIILKTSQPSKITDSANESKIISQAVTILKNGGLIIYPTETVYGVGVDTTNPEAVQKLLKYKSRREGKPLSVAVADEKMAAEYVKINTQAKKLYDRFLPGPFTVISKVLEDDTHVLENTTHDLDNNKLTPQLAPGVASEFNTLGIRIPDYPLLLEIVKKLGKPITSTSANSSGKKRPYTINDIFDNLSQKQKNLIDLVIDAGKLPTNKPSTIIDTTLSTPLTVREGDKNSGIDHSDDFVKISLHNSNNNPAISKNIIKNNIELTSHSDRETQDIAGKILLKNWNTIKESGLIIGLNGKLGAGKTIFAKGIAKFLKIEEMITSPTYSYIEEYDFNRHGVSGKFFHLDVWRVDSEHETKLLDITSLLKPNNVVVIEWWGQVRESVERNLMKDILDEKNYEKTDNKKSKSIFQPIIAIDLNVSKKQGEENIRAVMIENI